MSVTTMAAPLLTESDLIRVFIVDDHAVVRAGVRALLEADGRFEVVGEAGTAEQALPRIASTAPQVAILDVRLPDGRGTDLCSAIRAAHPATACLVFTSFADDDTVFEAILAGATGFLLKEVGARGLIDAVVQVAAGNSLIDQAVTNRLFDRIRHPQPAAEDRLHALTPLERSILRHVTEGRTNREIAPKVHLSESTVKNYVSSILRKLNLNRRTEAAVYALRCGELGD